MKKIVVSKEMFLIFIKTSLKFITAGLLIWGIVLFFNLFMKDANKLMSTETVDVSSFKGRIFNSSEVSNMPSSCLDVKVDRSTSLAFDSTALLLYQNAGVVIWKPDNMTNNVGLCYTYVSPGGAGDNFYSRVKYSAEKKEIIFYVYKHCSLSSAIIASLCLFILAFLFWFWLWFKIEGIFN